MKCETMRKVLTVVFLAVIAVFVLWRTQKDVGDCTTYNCDVKAVSLTTKIAISKDGEKFATVSGKLVRLVTDPLNMYDMSDNKIAYADDSYHLIAQDSHVIYEDGEVTAEMVGLVKIIGEAYDIYDKEGERIASVTFNASNTNGEMYDNEKNLIADYNSKLGFKDFQVRIMEDCKLSDKTVLMIFCSYYSDHAADSK